MLEAFGAKFKETLGGNLYPGLMGMFLFLHFYYGVPMHGWEKVGVGIVAVLACTLILSLIAFKLGNGFRSASALISAALALDFFYRGQLGKGTEHLLFEYLWNGPAAINFASFGLSSVWLLSQVEPSALRPSSLMPVTPNHFIERTLPGKPGDASHDKR